MSAKEMRMQIGMNIIELMHERDDLPLPNVHRLAKTMQEYFWTEGFEDDLVDAGYRWRPSVDYWKMHLGDIRSEMRKDRRRYFEFVRNQGELTGQWKFVSEAEYEVSLKRNHADISTRVDTHNDKFKDGRLAWELPKALSIADIPSLPVYAG